MNSPFGGVQFNVEVALNQCGDSIPTAEMVAVWEDVPRCGLPIAAASSGLLTFPSDSCKRKKLCALVLSERTCGPLGLAAFQVASLLFSDDCTEGVAWVCCPRQDPLHA